MFEDKELADQAVVAVEKRIHHEDMATMESVKQPTTAHDEVAAATEIAEKRV